MLILLAVLSSLFLSLLFLSQLFQYIVNVCIWHAGTGVEAHMNGKRKLQLHNHGETYEMNCPNFLFRFLPTTGIEWIGNVTIRCQETGLVAELSYIRQSFFGFRANRRRIKGKIFDSLSTKILYKIDGHWDRYFTFCDFYAHLFCIFSLIRNSDTTIYLFAYL